MHFHDICNRQKDKLHTVGQIVYESDYYRQGWAQTHHRRTNVGSHSENVAAIALYLKDRLGMSVNEEALILGSLAHDLGLIGRDEKYTTAMETYTMHPVDSVDVAREVLGNKFNPTIQDMIENHMWPLTTVFPDTKEGVLLIMADKICSLQESGVRLAEFRKRLYKRVITSLN